MSRGETESLGEEECLLFSVMGKRIGESTAVDSHGWIDYPRLCSPVNVS